MYLEYRIVTGEGKGGSNSFPVSRQNPRFLISRCEKHFKVSHYKVSHKVKVLARIYFSITG
jgi:hypothetical protein